jgi:hypothetical protein
MVKASPNSTSDPNGEGVEMKPKAAATYLSLLVPSGLFFAIVWAWLAPNRFYHCADPVPLQSFIPPFLHEHAGRPMDTYIAPEYSVYIVWFVMVIASFALPIGITAMVMNRFKYNRWREVRRSVSSRPPTMRADALPQGK